MFLGDGILDVVCQMRTIYSASHWNLAATFIYMIVNGIIVVLMDTGGTKTMKHNRLLH